MSKAADEGKNLAQKFKSDMHDATEMLLNDPTCRQNTMGEAAISLMQDGMPVNKATLKSLADKRIATSSPGFNKMRWERLLDWLESLPEPKTT